MCTGVLIATAKRRKQPKYPSVDGWIRETWYIYMMGYYLTLKKKSILLSGARQPQKVKCHMISHVGSLKLEPIEVESRVVVSRGWRSGQLGRQWS